MRKKTIITIPFQLAVDTNLSSAAKAIYLVLKSFQKGNQKLNLSHREIIERSKLSHLTVTKALKNLEEMEWILIERNLGSPNTYSFTPTDF